VCVEFPGNTSHRNYVTQRFLLEVLVLQALPEKPDLNFEKSSKEQSHGMLENLVIQPVII
jgi:hypothetical protein